MEKHIKYLLVGLSIIVIANLVINLLSAKSDNALHQALVNLNKSQQKLDSSLAQISSTRIKIDSIKKTITDFKSYMQLVKKRVEVLDLEQRISINNYRIYKDSLQNTLDGLYSITDTTVYSFPDFIVID